MRIHILCFVCWECIHMYSSSDMHVHVTYMYMWYIHDGSSSGMHARVMYIYKWYIHDGYNKKVKSVDWLRHWLVDWLIAESLIWLVDWLVYWSFGSIDWLVDWWTGSLICWLIAWLADWVCVCNWWVVWLIDWLTDWSIVLLIDSSIQELPTAGLAAGTRTTRRRALTSTAFSGLAMTNTSRSLRTRRGDRSDDSPLNR